MTDQPTKAIPAKISADDADLAALKTVLDILTPFDRTEQLRIMACATISLKQYKYSRLLLDTLIAEAEVNP